MWAWSLTAMEVCSVLLVSGPKSTSQDWMTCIGLVDSASLSAPLTCIPSALSCRSGAPPARSDTQTPLAQGPQHLHFGVLHHCEARKTGPIPEAQTECTACQSHRVRSHPWPHPWPVSHQSGTYRGNCSDSISLELGAGETAR